MSAEHITEAAQCLTFKLDTEIYALEISKVQSVLDFEQLTIVPRMPDFMRGVINLRGSVVPIIDMRLKFGMTQTEKTVDSCIIIAEIEMEDELTILGMLADSVQEVITLEPEHIEPAPKIGTRLNTEFIKGMGKQNEEFLMILDLDKVFSLDDLGVIQDNGGTSEELQPEKEILEAS
jgi:purine-binding chemotaxis protein CheW